MGELSPEQKTAVEHDGKHIRLLAGPGTGKTRTIIFRARYLIEKVGIPPKDILLLTFTRAATFELRKRIETLLGVGQDLPRVSTLHAFALSNLLRNARIVEKLPKPLRIADDWEERNIIQEDLKRELSCKVREIQEKFSLLSADWQTLTVDEEDWEKKFSDPSFIGAWRTHRNVFGYTLRSELVYQLKKALEQAEKFDFDRTYKHILVDEYQDLNRSDLSVIRMLVEKLDTSLFVAGDDDQSIYGFRQAQPEGIRRFSEDYEGANELELTYCMRYGKEIMEISEFVANLDEKRLRKGGMKIPEGAHEGEVELLRFSNQDEEADGIARICDSLIKGGEMNPEDILILLRSDFNKVMSKPIKAKLEELGLPVNVNVETETPLDAKEGRLFLSHLRLAINIDDHLAWRTILQLHANKIGAETMSKITRHCSKEGIVFSTCLMKIKDGEIDACQFGSFLKKEIEENCQLVDRIAGAFESTEEEKSLIVTISKIKKLYPLEIEEVTRYLEGVCYETDIDDLEDLLKKLSSSIESIEQEIERDKINILTMHKAKGLTASIVMIVGVEDQNIPGRQQGSMIGDERRLLFVSLSRAKEAIFITYCTKRTGAQAYTGRQNGKPYRELTQFLQDGPLTPKRGRDYLSERGL